MSNKKITSLIDYIGSKVKLAPTLAGIIEDEIGIVDGVVFCEAFAGTAALSRWFQANRKPHRIVTNDTELYSVAICRAAMQPTKISLELYAALNQLPGYHGFMTSNCSPAGYHKRKFFTADNARKIDGIKFHINKMFADDIINQAQRVKLLGELVMAADKVSNTASVYGAFLKDFKDTAKQPLTLRPANESHDHNTTTEVFNLRMDANELMTQTQGDILYIDPPYNQRQYSDNYHVLNFIAEPYANKVFKPKGVTGLPPVSARFRSNYCRKHRVHNQFDNLLGNADFKHIAISYSSDGLLEIDRLKSICKGHGEIIACHEIEYNKFKANSRKYDTGQTTEYLIIMQKMV